MQYAVYVLLSCLWPPESLSPAASQAALEAVWHVPCGGITYGDDNLCFIANDWHTALLPVYLQVCVVRLDGSGLLWGPERKSTRRC